MSRIDLHIDRLVLEGFDLAPGDARRLGAAIEQELAALVAIDGLAPGGSSLERRVVVPAFELRGNGNLQGWGSQIASAIHGALPGAGSPGGSRQ